MNDSPAGVVAQLYAEIKDPFDHERIAKFGSNPYRRTIVLSTYTKLCMYKNA